MGSLVEGIRVPDRAQALNGLFSLDTLRSVSGVAKYAVKSLGRQAASLAGATDAPSFADVFGSKEPTEPKLSVLETREKLASAIEAVLTRMGVPIDPAISFVAEDDGSAHLEGDHERAAEIEANLREDPTVRGLVEKLLGSAAGADLRIVLHSIPTS